MANVYDNLIIAFPCPPESGSPYTLTLASRLGHMFEMAERRFGPRDQSYTILGFEFRAGLPQIWFPGNAKHVIVQLDSANLYDQNLPLLQMAHECVHLLTPVLPANVSVLEEGLATYFSKEYMASHVGGVWFTGDQKCGHAEMLARKLLLLNADAIKHFEKLFPSSLGPLLRIFSKYAQTCQYICQNSSLSAFNLGMVTLGPSGPNLPNPICKSATLFV